MWAWLPVTHIFMTSVSTRLFGELCLVSKRPMLCGSDKE